MNIRSRALFMTPAAPVDADLLVRASRLYYLEERGQAEIARLLRISRPGVSRLLQRARDGRDAPGAERAGRGPRREANALASPGAESAERARALRRGAQRVFRDRRGLGEPPRRHSRQGGGETARKRAANRSPTSRRRRERRLPLLRR